MLSDERALQILQYINTVFRQQIDHADKKAATLIAIAAVLLTFNRAMLGLDQSALGLRFASLDGALSLALAVALLVSMSLAFLTIIPRIDSNVRSILFWRTWIAESGRKTWLERCRDAEFVRDEFLRDIHLVSQIVERKMRWLRLASQLLYGAVAIFILFVLRRTFS